MIYEMTVQFRVLDMKKGLWWYETLLNKKPDLNISISMKRRLK
ncbi:hypothetical protein [Paenibacillus sp. FSL R5-0490]|nr:hypothetical protein [Paenibacillus sp. FSL R5-0490]